MAKTTYESNEKIKVNYLRLPSNSKNWVGLFQRNAKDEEYIVRMYSNNLTNGTMTFKDLPVGEYDARLFFKDSYHLEYEVSFTVIN